MRPNETLLTSTKPNEAFQRQEKERQQKWERCELLMTVCVESRENSEISTKRAIDEICYIAHAAINNHELPENGVNKLVGQFIRRCINCQTKEGSKNGQNRVLADLIRRSHPLLIGMGFKTGANRQDKLTTFEHQSEFLKSFGINLSASAIAKCCYQNNKA
jgi:hypothetical protein